VTSHNFGGGLVRIPLAHARLLAVVKGQSKGIAERGKRAFGRISRLSSELFRERDLELRL
jgi:hypothetical protein